MIGIPTIVPLGYVVTSARTLDVRGNTRRYLGQRAVVHRVIREEVRAVRELHPAGWWVVRPQITVNTRHWGSFAGMVDFIGWIGVYAAEGAKI